MILFSFLMIIASPIFSMGNDVCMHADRAKINEVCAVPNLDIEFTLKFREVLLCQFDDHAGCKEMQSAFAQYHASICSHPKTVPQFMICHTDPKQVLLNAATVAELKRNHDLNLWNDASKFELIMEYGKKRG